MKKTLQLIDWNFCFHGYNKEKLAFLFSRIKGEACILLQEIVPEFFDYLLRTYGDTYRFVYSGALRRPGIHDTEARNLGVVIACTKGIDILDSGIIERALLPERTAWAILQYGGRELRVLTLHSLTSSDYGRAKSLQYNTCSEFLESFRPDIIGMDANEPRVDACTVDEMEFHDSGYGAVAFFRHIQRSGLSDAYVRANGITACEEGKCLATSYTIRSRPVRYDFLFVKDSIPVTHCAYLYEEAVAAGSDHALLLSELEI